ncbi:hypothetical protein F7734_50470 [Scytonema sp. UIC 10036]|uniref:hypothetical protein n=1 Tax=Scytonema sp. UIC 10036 TaxID=2304196 RepID=UPI0012DAC4C0|nr:hypothetical protein [Scytonema sp. UIC 10036]MUH00067.1 hypothetical protein [Scytonema sp. UIC 10036]
MNKHLPQEQDREILSQLSTEELVSNIIEQGNVIRELHNRVLELQQEIDRLKLSRDLDSKIS